MNNKINIIENAKGHVINEKLYSHFIEHLGGCVYDGIWVGENSHIENIRGIRSDTVSALKKLEIPVIRWPGGLFADSYHWQDGIGDRTLRPIRRNLGWNMLEDNAFGTHEFMDFCKMIGAEPYLCINSGDGTVEEARSWAEYCNCTDDTTLTRKRKENGSDAPFNVKIWGIGNEANYCMDGMMTVDHYVNVYRNYAGYVKRHASGSVYGSDEKFNSIKMIAVSPNAKWAEKLLSQLTDCINYVDLIAPHFYIGRRFPLDLDVETKYANLLSSLEKLEDVLTQFSEIAKKYSTDDHPIQIALDEFGIWYPEATPLNGMKSNSTSLMDAIFVAKCFHLFHSIGDRLYMANLAQTINVAQALIITEKEKMVLTPIYYVYDLFKAHKNNRRIECNIESRELSVSASISNDNEIFISVINQSLTEDVVAGIALSENENWAVSSAEILTADTIYAHNTFENPNEVISKAFIIEDINHITFKAMSIVTIKLIKG